MKSTNWLPTQIGSKWEKKVPWLKKSPSQALQQSLKDFDRTFKNFFEKRADFPCFKKRGNSDSFRFPQGFEIDQGNSRMKLPTLGWILYRNNRDILGSAKNTNLSQSGFKWFASVQTEREVERSIPTATSTVGIDMGIIRFAPLSDGSFSAEIPGKTVAAKSGLNKSILDQGWFEFRRQLKYKLNWMNDLFLSNGTDLTEYPFGLSLSKPSLPFNPSPSAGHAKLRANGEIWQPMALRSVSLLFFPLLLAAASGHASLCDSGRRQSPINITAAAITPGKQPAMLPDYRQVPLKLANDGHTVRVRLGNSGQLTLGTEHYSVQQFHFHTPGGDQINGETFPFAAHILHKSRTGQLLAIVVPFRLGVDNPLLAQLIPLIPVQPGGDQNHPTVSVSASALLPRHLGYYRYTGSLSAAPCTEGVQWLVLKQPLTLSAAQLAAYKQRFADNMRPVNPLHQRPVFEGL